jgi:GT2 family glycosyltransferase
LSAKVLVSIVTYNSQQHLGACLESLKTQSFRDFSVSLWDNASADATSTVIRDYGDILGFTHLSDHNLGFCAAHNRLIASSASEYSLVLNPDVVLDSRFLEVLIGEMDLDPSAGSATGKLLRSQSTGPKILDSTGIYMTPNQRHLDRGSGEIDTGQYEECEYVFGASGAAAVFRRTMLEDIRNGDEFFDESFFAYREDADLAWRAQWMGWRCLYVPAAIGYHERKVLPENRAELPKEINMHSFKNRFLLRIKNMDPGTYARFFMPITVRDAAALIYVLLKERSSLRGIFYLMQAFPRAWAWRKSLKTRRRVAAGDIRSWFSRKPVSKPNQGLRP